MVTNSLCLIPYPIERNIGNKKQSTPEQAAVFQMDSRSSGELCIKPICLHEQRSGAPQSQFSTVLRLVVQFKNVSKILKLMGLITGCVHWVIQGMPCLISLQSVTKMSLSEGKHFHSPPGFFFSK